MVIGCLAMGLLLGAATGLALALAPDRLLRRPPLRGLLAALTAGTPVVLLVVAALSWGGSSLSDTPLSIHVVAWSVPLVIALVVAARSGDIAGRR